MTALEPSLDLATLATRYRNGTLTVAGLVREIERRIAAAGDDHVWISRVPDDVLAARALALDTLDAKTRAALPLFGIPFGVKDNIDAAGLATTAACPAFAYQPGEDAPVVARLQAAGALLIGKTNLDQFATGLVGVRSPYGVVSNAFDRRYIPGGSSAGSAVAVAAGLVSFALGTDTAGSGRVPAAFNNIVGLKPTKGLLSLQGVVPACASLDCVSIFALTVEDAETVLSVATDVADEAISHDTRQAAAIGATFRFGVLRSPDFIGDALNAALYRNAVAAFEAIGGTAIAFDYAPFAEVAKLLYDGPWVAERMTVVERIYRDRPEAMLPVTRSVIGNADRFTAVDAFRAQYRLEELRRATLPLWREIDAMVLPTAPTIYTIEEVNAEPVTLNSRLGHYTNFVNLLDLAALAVPAGFRADGLPFGVTLMAPAMHDRALASLGGRFARQLDLPLGATGHRLPPQYRHGIGGDGMMLAVVGAHLSGMPLNHQLTEGGATLIAATRTAPYYRLYEIAGTPPRPGMVRTINGAGRPIDAELWSVTPALLGALVAVTEAPLSIGNVELADGRWVKGFLCEAGATAGARDITAFGSWRRFLAAQH